jgi:hypothetical protein
MAFMPRWPDKIAEAVTFDVAFALNFKVGRTLRPLTELERKVVAKIIVDHLQLSNWVIERGAPGAHTSPENWPKRPTRHGWWMSALPPKADSQPQPRLVG